MGIFRRLRARRPAVPDVPMPPLPMRQLVGLEDERFFDNPAGGLVFPDRRARRIYDFGCGCGRVARQLVQQREPVERYVGVDLHPGMIRWCRANLTPLAPQFEFVHHDVENPGFNPGPDKPKVRPLPGDDASFDLVYAHSVFTHLRESQTPHYLGECARLLAPGGVIRSTWFLFDKAQFPMMQPFQNALYINEDDPTNAVIVDRGWLHSRLAECGLEISAATPPAIRGFHWALDLSRAGDAEPVELPLDEAPVGSHPPPIVAVPAAQVR